MELFIKNKEPMEGFDRFPPIEQAIDLIYDFPAAVNTQDAEYNALFYALGRSDQKPQRASKIFEINALIAMKDAGFEDAGLSFSYTCAKCKSSVGLFSHRCPVCYELGSMEIRAQISEKTGEIGQTF